MMGRVRVGRLLTQGGLGHHLTLIPKKTQVVFLGPLLETSKGVLFFFSLTNPGLKIIFQESQKHQNFLSVVEQCVNGYNLTFHTLGFKNAKISEFSSFFAPESGFRLNPGDGPHRPGAFFGTAGDADGGRGGGGNPTGQRGGRESVWCCTPVGLSSTLQCKPPMSTLHFSSQIWEPTANWEGGGI